MPGVLAWHSLSMQDAQDHDHIRPLGGRRIDLANGPKSNLSSLPTECHPRLGISSSWGRDVWLVFGQRNWFENTWNDNEQHPRRLLGRHCESPPLIYQSTEIIRITYPWLSYLCRLVVSVHAGLIFKICCITLSSTYVWECWSCYLLNPLSHLSLFLHIFFLSHRSPPSRYLDCLGRVGKIRAHPTASPSKFGPSPWDDWSFCLFPAVCPSTPLLSQSYITSLLLLVSRT